MNRLIAISLCSYAASFATLLVTGGSDAELLWIPTFVSAITTGLWFLAAALVDRAYRHYVDAKLMMKGVCPSCRTFNSLAEVTSTETQSRYIECMACGEKYRVQVIDGKVGAERLGKLED